MLTPTGREKSHRQSIWLLEAAGCQVTFTGSEDVFIRFANNGITTSGYRITSRSPSPARRRTSVRATRPSANGRDEALKNGVEQAEELARISKPNPEDMPALGPQKYAELSNFDDHHRQRRAAMR